MKCPICQTEMRPVRDGSILGSAPGRPQLDLKEVIGYNCPTQNDLPHGAKTSHCTVRGLNTTITLHPYRLSIWDFNPDINNNIQNIILYHYRPHNSSAETVGGSFVKVCNLPNIKLGNEEYLKNKLALYVLLS